MFSARPLLILLQTFTPRQATLLLCSSQFLSMFCLTSQQIAMPFIVRTANKVAVPAFVYSVQNNLYYIALANIDATTYSVTYQLRILTTGILAVVVLQQRLTFKQWMGLVVSLIGVVLVQLDNSHISTRPEGSRFIGVAAAFSMCWTSAFAGVYFEKMLKYRESCLWLQNLRLSLLTLAFAFLSMISSDGAHIRKDGLFHGWSWLVWFLTTANALGGLAVSLVMKHADNVKKTYCQTIAIGVTAIISIHVGERPFSVVLLSGVSLVILSVFMYSTNQPATVPTTPQSTTSEIARFSNPDISLEENYV